MKMKDALNIIHGKKSGFMVHFEKREGNILRIGNFPEKESGEKLIPTEEEAWKWAMDFSNSADPSYVNIYVINHDYTPVPEYQRKQLRSSNYKSLTN